MGLYLFKISLLGLLIVVFYDFAIIIGRQIEIKILEEYAQIGTIILYFYKFLVVYIAWAFFVHRIKHIFEIMYKNKKWSLFLFLVTGVGIGLLIDDIFYRQVIFLTDFLQGKQLIGLLGIPFFLSAYLFYEKISLCFKETFSNVESYFLPDVEVVFKNDDCLNINNKVENIAEKIINNRSNYSFVFGIDGPWGIGKSSLINLCKEFWQENYKNDVIVYSYNPLNYESKEKFFLNFTNGLIGVLNEELFAPNLKKTMQNYIEAIKDLKPSLSLGVIKFEIPLKSSRNNDLKNLKECLEKSNKKLIVIIDDLDRLDFCNIKEILYSIKIMFSLPNISFVLAYSSENIINATKKDIDAQKVIEFLEKFINVKFNLYFNGEILMSFLDSKWMDNLEDEKRIFLKEYLGGYCQEILRLREFHKYLPFIGDIRKLKRLVNTMILLNIDKVNTAVYDFNKPDLINLLLIYIQYPHLFLTIYSAETYGQKNFFSVRKDINSGKYEHTENYNSFMKSYKLNKHQKFLLEKIFNFNERLKTYTDEYDHNTSSQEPSIEMLSNCACFNGDHFGNRIGNLEYYLKLIVNGELPPLSEQYKHYKMLEKDYLDGNKTVDEIFEICSDKYMKEELLRVLARSFNPNFASDKCKEIVMYILDHLDEYSLSHNKSSYFYDNLRNNSLIFAVMLINKIGRTNFDTEKRWEEIGNYIFNEVLIHLEKNFKESKCLLDLNDLLTFRLACCRDRGGDSYEVYCALAKHSNPDASIEGNVKDLLINEMREISQSIFKCFLDSGINIFIKIREIDDAVRQNAGDLDVDELSDLKQSLLSFIIYQLGSYKIDSGIGCGYYDLTGNKNKKGINLRFSEYLIEQFNLNFDDFIIYMLLLWNNARASRVDVKKSLTTVLSRKQISDFWRKNKYKFDKDKFRLPFSIVDDENLSTSLEELYQNLNEVSESNEVLELNEV